MKKTTWLQLFPGIWIVAGILFFFAARVVWGWMHYPHQIERLAKQLSSINIIQKAPVANHAGTLLGVIHTTEQGAGVFIEDIANKTEKKLCEATDVDYMASRDWVFGWSPDDRILAYSWDYTLNFAGTGGQRADGKIDSITNRIQSFAWLTLTNCAFIDESQQLVSVQFVAGRWMEAASWKLPDTNGPPESLQAVGTNLVVWHTRNILWRADVSSGEVRPLYSSAPKTIDGISYSKDTGAFLMVENTNRSSISSLVALSVGADGLQQDELTRKSSITSAQWINKGQGYACVVSRGDNSVLTIKNEWNIPENTLFTNGQVWSIFCDGESSHVYALADQSSEPAGIWRCDGNDGDVSCVVSPWANQEVNFHFQPALTEWAHYKAGSRTHAVGFDLVTPANFSRHKKYPLIIGTASYEWTPIPHGVYAQCLAKCGVYVALVHYRWNQGNPETVSAHTNNVLAVYNQLIANPNIDKNRVFLFGFSAGTEVVSELVKDYPGRWRGIMLLNPSSLPEAEAGMTSRVLATAGSGENEEDRFRRYQEELFKVGIPMEWHIHENAQHVERDQAAMYERTIWMANMVFDE
jgi:dienelactone hydrolase